MRGRVAAGILVLLLFAAGATTAATLTELHEWENVVTLQGGGKKHVVTYRGTITDIDTIPDPVTVTETVTVTTAAPPPPSTTTTTTAPPPPPPPPEGGEALAPGVSWDAAYDAAACGKVFLVDGGYGPQTLTGFKSCAGNPIVFQDVGRTVVQHLSFQGASDVTVIGAETAYKTTAPGVGNQFGVWVGPVAGNDGYAAGSKRIRLEQIDAGSVNSWFVTGLTISGGDLGPCNATSGGGGCGNNMQDVGRDVLIEDVYVHDYDYDASAPDAHWECMYVNANTNFTIRRSRFERCAIFDLFLTNSGPDAARFGHENTLIEGNDFGPATDGHGNFTRGWSALSVSWCQNTVQPGYRNLLIRGNDFRNGQSGIEVDLNADAAGCVWENARVEDNMGLMWQGRCQRGWLYARNTWVGGGSCG